MKTELIFILFLTGLMACNGLVRVTDEPDSPVTSFKMIREHFMEPPVSFSTAPFWVWNDRVTPEKIERQLKLYKNQGIHMVFIHPRPGLITEYLSREWMELTKYAVNKAEELDMKIWLYDENSFPSGFAGGHVPAMMPESYNQGAGLQLQKMEKLTREDSGKYFLVLKRIGNQFANVSNGIQRYYDQPGDYYAFSKWYFPSDDAWFGGWSYVDLLADGVTEKFIKLTMRDYEKTLGEELGSRIPGIFTDEPNINTRGGEPWVIRWTPALFDKFEEKYGYQLQTYLPSIFEDIGDYRNIRHDYYALLLDLFIERWAKPWFEYTESKNLEWTGHYWEHGWPNPKHGGDNMAMYAWHQIPGIDMLFNSEEARPDQFGNIRAVKELSSVANQMGRNRALSETYGGAGWELTFEDMKRLGDWEYALGVNFMNQHLSYMTIKGARKRDFPQSMSYHTPWWDNYQVLNRYFHRLSYVLSAGKQNNRILVIEPTSSTWMYFSPVQEGEHLGVEGFLEKYTRSFHSFLDQLEKFQVEYDLGSERLIREFGNNADGKFLVGEKAYDLVVLPPLFENIESGTLQYIEPYLKTGGRILSFGPVPDRLDGNESHRIQNLSRSFSEQWIVQDSLDRQIITDYFASEGFIPETPEEWGGRIFHMRRQLIDGQLIFLVNFDKSSTSNIHFEVNGESLIRLDPLDGSVREVPVEDQGGGVQQVRLTLPPSNSALYFIPESKIQGIGKVSEKDFPAQAVNSLPTKVEAVSPNVLTLDYCDLTIDGMVYEGMYFYNAADTIYKHHLKEPYGFNHNPWSIAVQYRTSILDKNSFDSLSGFDVIFPFYIEDDFIPEELKAVVEWSHLYRFIINGIEVTPMNDEWWLDRSFGVLDLSGHTRNGRNELQISIHPMDILAELEPVYLLGNFSLESMQNGWIIKPPEELDLGSWKSRGFPYYADLVDYTKVFNHSGHFSGYKVKLNAWQGTVAEVWVNEEKAGIIGWPPYRLDISPWIRQGENTVSVRVCGSLKNLLGPHHNNPREGVVTPWSFFYAPEKQPAGSSYHLLDYGLFEDFEILGYVEHVE
ncbi:MAG: hypothetical protein KFF73_03895 [Cyclobacteriaceae bacterium]|nr:hypothetical protein [Cyclobacteriaceae bacterium]